MIRKALRLALPLALLAGCSADRAYAPSGRAPGAPMVAGTVYIYRGVNVLPGTTNINWSNASFGVSGNPPTLSFFDAVAPGRACWLRVPVSAPNVPVVPGQGGDVTLSTGGVAGAGPSPWAAVFDNVPPGHWSIAKTVILPGGGSNNLAGTVAGQVFQASTAAGQVTILDGDVQGCQP